MFIIIMGCASSECLFSESYFNEYSTRKNFIKRIYNTNPCQGVSQQGFFDDPR